MAGKTVNKAEKTNMIGDVDLNQPFAKTVGKNGTSYEQNGKKFDAAGKPVTASKASSK